MAYGINAPFGLRPINSGIGTSTWNTLPYPIASGYATSLYTGDPVSIVNGKVKICEVGENLLGVFQGCKYQNSSNNFVASPYWPASTLTYQELDAQAMICTDPNVVYSIQASNSGASAENSQLGIAAINLFANAIFAQGGTLPVATGTTYPGTTQVVQNNPTTGNTRTGQSGYYLDCSSFYYGNPPISGSNSLTQSTWQPLKVKGLEATPGNQYLLNPQVSGTLTEIPTGAFNNALVTINASLEQPNSATGIMSMAITTNDIPLAAFKTSFATPVPVIQGAEGYIPFVSQVTLTVTSGGTAAAAGGDVLLIYGTSAIAASAVIATQTEIITATTAAAGTLTVFSTYGAVVASTAIADATPYLSLKTQDANWTAGDNSTFKLTVVYSFIKV